MSTQSYQPSPLDTSEVELSDSFLQAGEALAAELHEHRNQKLAADGWSYGTEYNADAKTDPTLVPYGDLPESARKAERQEVRQSLKILSKLGYQIDRSPKQQLAYEQSLLSEMHNGRIASPMERPAWDDIEKMVRRYETLESDRIPEKRESRYTLVMDRRYQDEGRDRYDEVVVSTTDSPVAIETQLREVDEQGVLPEYLNRRDTRESPSDPWKLHYFVYDHEQDKAVARKDLLFSDTGDVTKSTIREDPDFRQEVAKRQDLLQQKQQDYEVRNRKLARRTGPEPVPQPRNRKLYENKEFRNLVKDGNPDRVYWLIAEKPDSWADYQGIASSRSAGEILDRTRQARVQFEQETDEARKAAEFAPEFVSMPDGREVQYYDQTLSVYAIDPALLRYPDAYESDLATNTDDLPELFDSLKNPVLQTTASVRVERNPDDPKQTLSFTPGQADPGGPDLSQSRDPEFRKQAEQQEQWLQEEEERRARPVYFVYDRTGDDIVDTYSRYEEPHTPEAVQSDLNQIIDDYRDSGAALDQGRQDLEDYGGRSTEVEQQYEVYQTTQEIWDDPDRFYAFWDRGFDHQEPRAEVTVTTPVERVEDRYGPSLDARGMLTDPGAGAEYEAGEPTLDWSFRPEFEQQLPKTRDNRHEVHLESSLARGAEEQDHGKDPQKTTTTIKERPVSGGGK